MIQPNKNCFLAKKNIEQKSIIYYMIEMSSNEEFRRVTEMLYEPVEADAFYDSPSALRHHYKVHSIAGKYNYIDKNLFFEKMLAIGHIPNGGPNGGNFLLRVKR